MKNVTTTQPVTHSSRTVFLVDGLNLYHSVRQAQRDTCEPTKWLDLRNLCSSYLPLIGKHAGEHAQLERLVYFSASPTHLSRGKQESHEVYMRYLQKTDVEVELGKFKPKSVCYSQSQRGQEAPRHEEKQTDVAIATRLLEVCLSDEADTVVLVTGDTDQAPAVRTCNRLFPQKLTMFAFPYKRANKELKEIAPMSFSINPTSYIKHQACFEARTEDK